MMMEPLFTTAEPDRENGEAEAEVLGWVCEVLSRLDDATRRKVVRRVLFVIADEDRIGVARRLPPMVRWVVVLQPFECGREYALHTIAHEIGHVLLGKNEGEAEAFAEALGFPHPSESRLGEEEARGGPSGPTMSGGSLNASRA